LQEPGFLKVKLLCKRSVLFVHVLQLSHLNMATPMKLATT
jgi:hypothetical protein